MSQINNVITTTFRAAGGNVTAELGSVARGFGGIYNRINDNTRMSSMLNSQWRAFGNTLRYAISGSALFGLARMYTQLRDINTQLGEMAALTTAGTGGSAFSGAQVTQLGQSLQRVAIDTITPLSQVNDAAINFLSTVQGVQPGNAVADMLTEISQAAKIAQTDITDLTQAATTQQIAFGRPVNKQTVGQASRMFEELILQAPGGPAASSTIAQAMPSLASMFQLGRGRNVPPNVGQAQMYGLTLAALRTGMPASTAMRGLTYLLQSIAQPTGKARGALASIGVTPEFIQQNGINAALMRLLHTVTQTGNAKQLAAIPDDVVESLDASGGNLPGIPAQEMQRLRTMIPRIHGIRAAVILASQLRAQPNVLSVDQDIQTMLDVQRENSKQSQALAQAWRNYRKRARLQDAANAINTMSLQVAQTFEPVFGFVAEHGVLPIAHAMQHHRTATKVAAISGTAIVAALGVGRLLGISKLGGNAVVRGEAIRDALSGATGLGASPEHPMYVIVVGQLFGGGQNAPSVTKDLEHTAEKDAENAAKAGGILGIARVIARGARRGAGALAGAARRSATLASDAGGIIEEGGAMFSTRAGALRVAGKVAGRLGIPAIIADYFYNAQNAGGKTENLYAAAARMYGPNSTVERLQLGQIHGQAEVFLTLDINQGGKVTRKRVHIPLSMLASGGRVPSSRGQAGKTARSHG